VPFNVEFWIGSEITLAGEKFRMKSLKNLVFVVEESEYIAFPKEVKYTPPALSRTLPLPRGGVILYLIRVGKAIYKINLISGS
jgi:hypothetical protein